jgi:hypothetical protein
MGSISGPPARVVAAIGLNGIEAELANMISNGMGGELRSRFETKWGCDILDAYASAVVMLGGRS